MFTVAILALVAAAAASSSSSSSSGHVEIAGTVVRPKDVVQFGSSFRFYKVQNNATYQDSVADCLSLTLQASNPDRLLGASDYEAEQFNDGGFRVCFDPELISINRFLTKTAKTPLNGLFWSGNVYEQDDDSDTALFRIGVSMFFNGKWSPFNQELRGAEHIDVSDDDDDGQGTDDEVFNLKRGYFCCSSRNNNIGPIPINGENGNF